MLRFLNIFLLMGLLAGSVHSMRLGDMWGLVADLESACADRTMRMEAKHRRNLERFIAFSEEERARNSGWAQKEATRLKAKKESQATILTTLEKTITEFQETGSYEGFLHALLSQRADIVQGRVSTAENMKLVLKLPLGVYSQYHNLNILRFAEEASWEHTLSSNAEDESRFLRMISDTYHALIKCAWEGADLARLGDEVWNLVNQSPSLWPFLAGEKPLAETAIEDGTVFALIKFCCDDLCAPDGDRGIRFIEATARKKLNPNPNTFFLFDYDEKDTFLVGEYIALDLMNDPRANDTTPSRGHALMRQVAVDYVRAAKHDLRQLFKSLDFVHMSQLGMRGLPFVPVKHPRMPQPEARSAEEVAASFLEGLSLGAPQRDKIRKTRVKKGKKLQKAKHARKAENAISLEDIADREDELASVEPTEDETAPVGAVVVLPQADGPAAEVAPINIGAEMAKEYPYNYPKAVRVYNPHLLDRAQPVREKLDPQHQEFVDNLFSRDRGPNNITFQDFETFWSSMGGRIERGGGSHVHFLAPDNTPLWGTFVPHGRQAYGPSTIENLRSAAYWIGCRPSV